MPLKVITSSYLPANARYTYTCLYYPLKMYKFLPNGCRDAGASEQIIKVERLSIPPAEDRRRASVYLDVMEIQYTVSIANDPTERVVDSSAERCPPGTY
jgi:hypothetical protein